MESGFFKEFAKSPAHPRHPERIPVILSVAKDPLFPRHPERIPVILSVAKDPLFPRGKLKFRAVPLVSARERITAHCRIRAFQKLTPSIVVGVGPDGRNNRAFRGHGGY